MRSTDRIRRSMSIRRRSVENTFRSNYTYHSIEDAAHLESARAHNTRWLSWLTEEIGKLGLEVTPSVANFILIHLPKTKGRTSRDADAFLSARGLILREVSSYGLPDAL